MQAITRIIAFALSGAVSLIAQASPVDTGFHKFSQPVPGATFSFDMVAVPGGKVQLKTADGKGKEVALSPFWMSAHEVTYDAFDVFYKDESISQNIKVDAITRPSPQYIDFSQGMGKQGGFPVNSLSHTGALMYCRWLYEKTGIFYRLPTEAEWEYACRAGAKTAYPFGNDTAQLGTYAWYNGNSGGVYHKVGEKKPNAWGLYDMLGNVGEWVLDQYVPDYAAAITSNADPMIPHSSRYPKPLRGGHYLSTAQNASASARIPSEATWNRRDPQIPKSIWWMTDAPFAGFRLVRPLKQPSHEAIIEFFDQYITR